MPVSKSNDEYAFAAKPAQKETSITAHIVRSIAVTMSITEMLVLVESMGIDYERLTPNQRQIQQEFSDAIHALQ